MRVARPACRGRIADIRIYPLKGGRGVALSHADVLRGGLRHDRRFMVVRAKAERPFISQRTHPRLALVETALESLSTVAEPQLTLALRANGRTARVAIPPVVPDEPRPERLRVRVFDDEVAAVDVPGDAAALLSEHLGEPVRLVFMPDDVVRQVDLRYAKPGDRVGFADGFPVLLATQASLEDLNARIARVRGGGDGTPIPMNRFRPNLVVEGSAPYDEERFARVRVGGVTFRMPKRCSRCAVTLVDQATGELTKEPLRTLSTYRRHASSVYFAMNLVPDEEGPIAVGDEVTWLDPLPP